MLASSQRLARLTHPEIFGVTGPILRQRLYYCLSSFNISNDQLQAIH